MTTSIATDVIYENFPPGPIKVLLWIISLLLLLDAICKIFVYIVCAWTMCPCPEWDKGSGIPAGMVPRLTTIQWSAMWLWAICPADTNTSASHSMETPVSKPYSFHVLVKLNMERRRMKWGSEACKTLLEGLLQIKGNSWAAGNTDCYIFCSLCDLGSSKLPPRNGILLLLKFPLSLCRAHCLCLGP